MISQTASHVWIFTRNVLAGTNQLSGKKSMAAIGKLLLAKAFQENFHWWKFSGRKTSTRNISVGTPAASGNSKHVYNIALLPPDRLRWGPDMHETCSRQPIPDRAHWPSRQHSIGAQSGRRIGWCEAGITRVLTWVLTWELTWELTRVLACSGECLRVF